MAGAEVAVHACMAECPRGDRRVGYLVDGAGTALLAGYGPGIAGFTFAGEVLLMVWLLWQGRRMTIPQPS